MYSINKIYGNCSILSWTYPLLTGRYRLDPFLSEYITRRIYMVSNINQIYGKSTDTDRLTDIHTKSSIHRSAGTWVHFCELLKRTVWFGKRYIHAYVPLSLMIARSRTGIERANSARFKGLFQTTKMRMFLVSSIVSTYSNYNKPTTGSNRIKHQHTHHVNHTMRNTLRFHTHYLQHS